MVSVCILTKDKPGLIIPCVQGLLKQLRGHKFEILIGDTGSSDKTVLNFYDHIRRSGDKRLRITNLGAYHFSKNNNALAKLASGDILLFLNNDTLAQDDFLKPMIHALKEENVGVVGARLLFADGSIQHAGVHIEMSADRRLICYHPFQRRSGNMRYISVNRDYAAVTGACLMIRKNVFESVGGFTEGYVEECQDADLCLKIRESGRRVIYAAQAQLYHFENGTRTISELSRDRRLLHETWHGTSYWQGFGVDTWRDGTVFLRRGARGDVLACSAIARAYRKKNPKKLVFFATDFPELLDSNADIDIVGTPEQLTSTVTKSPTVSLVYETGDWLERPVSWIESMALSAGVKLGTIESRRPIIHGTDSAPNYTLTNSGGSRKPPYIVISTATGAPEKEWSPAGWNEFTSCATNNGIVVVAIGGRNDFLPRDAIDMRNCTLMENYFILRQAKAAVLLDSFPLHIGMAAAQTILLLTCKTSHHTGYLSPEVTEMRNSAAKETPYGFCRDIGCRHKFGDGTDNPCAAPILKNLTGKAVFERLIQLIGK